MDSATVISATGREMMFTSKQLHKDKQHQELILLKTPWLMSDSLAFKFCSTFCNLRSVLNSANNSEVSLDVELLKMSSD